MALSSPVSEVLSIDTLGNGKGHRIITRQLGLQDWISLGLAISRDQ
jgi:hypothetical protein